MYVGHTSNTQILEPNVNFTNFLYNRHLVGTDQFTVL